MSIELAIIGGSGLYNMAGVEDVVEIEVDTPFGKPSDKIITGEIYGRPIAFLPRHGRGHVLMPSEVPYRANIYALKSLGVRYIVAVSACGSLKEDFAPGQIVVPDQLYDNTRKRETSFFGRGLVAHIGGAHPFSPELSRVLANALKNAGATYHEGGAYVTIEGPRFSTKGEANTYRRWGMSLVGMTTSPEAFLAAEAEIAYACMAHVTDYDVWHETEEPVSVELVVKTFTANIALAKETINHLVHDMPNWEGHFLAHDALKGTFITERGRIPQQVLSELRPIVGRYFD